MKKGIIIELFLINCGQLVLVDSQDVDLVLNHMWTLDERGYLHTSKIRLHEAIADRLGMVRETIDHKDRNKLNNQRANLRPATYSQQNANQGIRKDNKTGFIGVSHCSGTRNFQAHVTVKGENIYIGRYWTAEAAAKARDKKAKELYGEFAVLNFDE